jgi:hypothetical protein
VNGTGEARDQFHTLITTDAATSPAAEPGLDDGNPFGPDPARLASLAGASDSMPFAGLAPPASAGQ